MSVSAGAARLTWFPGHMVRATRQILEQLANVDLVIEVRDARVRPFSNGGRGPLLFHTMYPYPPVD